MKRYLFTALLLINSPVIADTTMTNNPISNSSGSVTNLGVMNMPSKQFTNTLSLNQVQCQGDTLVIQPFLTGNYSGGMPKVNSFLEPIYSTKDVKGAFESPLVRDISQDINCVLSPDMTLDVALEVILNDRLQVHEGN